MRYDPIPQKLFAERRHQFAKEMAAGSIAIFFSNDHMPRSGDQFFPYRQDRTIFSMTGIEQPETILILNPEAKKKSEREILLILPTDPEHEIWNGKRHTAKEASAISGISSIRKTQDWKKILASLRSTSSSIYVNHAPAGNQHDVIKSQNDRWAVKLFESFPQFSFHPAGPILRKMAMIKHPVEIDLMKKAISVTHKAFSRVLKNMKPGLMEFEIEAELTYELTRHGCRHAFEPIIASGASASTLHYISNDKKILPGTLVLIDFGAEYANIASDMTRTIPASGRFNKEQRQVYESVLHVLTEVTNLLRPGNTLKKLNLEAGKLIESELIKLKILSRREIRRQDTEKPLWKKYFMHGVSHHLGYDVHDIAERDAPLRPGMVLTCEPGIYLPERGLGIRLENDVLVTKKAPVNLMSDIPVDPDEIESLMNFKT